MSQTAQLNLAQESAGADTPAAHYRAFDTSGKQATIQEIVEAFGGVDVVLVGEAHDDPIAHLLEAELLRRANQRHGLDAQGKGRPVALSLEMFERDVQIVVDEYLAGLISERHYLLSSRPWANYPTDYRPLVEYARENKLPIIAANAPARYVSRVSSRGPASLNDLSKEAKAWLPPLPFRAASELYAAKFKLFMGDAAGPPVPAQSPTPATTPSPHAPAQTPNNPHGALHLLDAQTLRDATMAHAITEQFRHKPNALIVHVNGKFHSEERLGVPEHIKQTRPKTRILVVTIIRDEGFPSFDADRHAKLGDFIILTNPALPPSR